MVSLDVYPCWIWVNKMKKMAQKYASQVNGTTNSGLQNPGDYRQITKPTSTKVSCGSCDTREFGNWTEKINCITLRRNITIKANHFIFIIFMLSFPFIVVAVFTLTKCPQTPQVSCLQWNVTKKGSKSILRSANNLCLLTIAVLLY